MVVSSRVLDLTGAEARLEPAVTSYVFDVLDIRGYHISRLCTGRDLRVRHQAIGYKRRQRDCSVRAYKAPALRRPCLPPRFGRPICS